MPLPPSLLLLLLFLLYNVFFCLGFTASAEREAAVSQEGVDVCEEDVKVKEVRQTYSVKSRFVILFPQESCVSDVSVINSVLVDTERVLALLQGLHACFMVQGLPILPSEEDCEKWLSLEIFSSGLETQPLSSIEVQPSNNAPFSSEMKAKSLQRQSISGSYETSRFFISGLMSSEFQDEKAGHFLFLVQRYCQQKNFYLPHFDQIPDHPIEKFGRLFMACLIKLHDLVPLALAVLDQEGPPNNEQDSTAIQLPPSLADVCKLVYDAKVTLVKAHQESLCSYEEVCKEPIARCCFIIDYIRSPMLNVINILHKHQLQVR